MGKRKTVPNRSLKPTKEVAAGRGGAPRGTSKEEENLGDAPVCGIRGERLVIDGTLHDLELQEEESNGRPWVLIYVDSYTRLAVGIKVFRGRHVDEN